MFGMAGSALALLAGCGSSKTSTSSSTAASATGTSASAAAKSPYRAGSASGARGSAGASTVGPPGAVLVSTKHGALGTLLAVGAKKLTVYLFEADNGAASACAGACTSVWPPVTTAATAKAGGSALASDLGTIARPDGTRQVTYKGHPLYFFARDKDQGDSYGQGIKSFGAGWYALAPNGNKIDNS
jgi:predicted lipoprotein with Yx(FWY)xxD motif